MGSTPWDGLGRPGPFQKRQAAWHWGLLPWHSHHQWQWFSIPVSDSHLFGSTSAMRNPHSSQDLTSHIKSHRNTANLRVKTSLAKFDWPTSQKVCLLTILVAGCYRLTENWSKVVQFTLWLLFNIAMENGPFIDGLPIKNGDFPWLC